MGSRPPDERRSSRSRSVATRPHTRSSCACTRESRFASHYLAAGDRGDAEEAVQDGFVKAYRALGRFRDGAPFRPWLLRIVANEARNRRRSAGRRAGLTLRAAAASGDAAPSPEAAALSQERRAELLEALGRLDERDRDVLVHRFLLELGEGETAAALGIRRGTVKSRTSRALERLRAMVGEEAS